MKREMSEESKSKTTSYAKCQKYQVIVSPNDNLEFTGNFLEGLKAIKTGNTYSATKFIQDFGTHFAEQERNSIPLPKILPKIFPSFEICLNFKLPY